jgi:hypothetical protein
MESRLAFITAILTLFALFSLASTLPTDGFISLSNTELSLQTSLSLATPLPTDNTAVLNRRGRSPPSKPKPTRSGFGQPHQTQTPIDFGLAHPCGLNRTTTANLEKGRLSYNKFVVETWESWLKHDERSYAHYMHDRFAENIPNSKNGW